MAAYEVGTQDGDVLEGSEYEDVLTGLNGSDRLFGYEGADLLFAGGGADRLDGGAGDDVLRGGTGRDLLLGGGGDDVLRGGAGSDRLVGGAGADWLLGGAGADSFVFTAEANGAGSAADVIADFAVGDSLVFEGYNFSPIIYPDGSGQYVRFEQVGEDVRIVLAAVSKGAEFDTEIARVLAAQVAEVRAASDFSGSVE